MQFQSLQFTVCKSAFLIYSTNHSASLCDKWKHMRLADTEHDAENAPYNAEAWMNPIFVLLSFSSACRHRAA